ncbi:MAG: pantetheine-phosphate adenylyltransferase [Acidobacteriaceae bacterium]|nr:pantetheine-phosphate adenylyltransferase [Acidobacteriaceae bacterium]MBV8570886.1 pantetheine-phosphate adenylyltransferase [Acidobacteriaceae bacterium]
MRANVKNVPVHSSTLLRGSLHSNRLPRQLIGIYPGSFDPLTNGHLDLIDRGSRLVDDLIVAILRNTQKEPLFSVEERTAMIRESTRQWGNVEVDSFDGLLIDYAARRNANTILRGIRAVSDYESELQMALINRRLRPETETIFLMASEENSFISSRMVKEIITLGGDVSSFVPPAVLSRLRTKVPN